MLLTQSRDSGVAALESLVERQGAFDYILLETTGLADPGNIAPLFWVDEGLGSSIYLDGVVTLVDAKNLSRSLEDTSSMTHGDPQSESLNHTTDKVGGAKTHKHVTTAHLQISHADVVVVNKADLVSQTELEGVIEHVRAINSLAKLHITTESKVPQLEGVLLDLHAYDEIGAADIDFAAKGHSHHDQVSRMVERHACRHLQCKARCFRRLKGRLTSPRQ